MLKHYPKTVKTSPTDEWGVKPTLAPPPKSFSAHAAQQKSRKAQEHTTSEVTEDMRKVHIFPREAEFIDVTIRSETSYLLIFSIEDEKTREFDNSDQNYMLQALTSLPTTPPSVN